VNDRHTFGDLLDPSTGLRTAPLAPGRRSPAQAGSPGSAHQFRPGGRGSLSWRQARVGQGIVDLGGGFCDKERGREGDKESYGLPVLGRNKGLLVTLSPCLLVSVGGALL
jgi:hypothetical protein